MVSPSYRYQGPLVATYLCRPLKHASPLLPHPLSSEPRKQLGNLPGRTGQLPCDIRDTVRPSRLLGPVDARGSRVALQRLWGLLGPRHTAALPLRRLPIRGAQGHVVRHVPEVCLPDRWEHIRGAAASSLTTSTATSAPAAPNPSTPSSLPSLPTAVAYFHVNAAAAPHTLPSFLK